MKCPQCGAENENSAAFCSTCGGELMETQLDWRARILFFATPPFLLAFCMILAFEVDRLNSLETGVEWGLLLSTLFLFIGGGFWLIRSQIGGKMDPISPWTAGMFGICQLLASSVLSLPLQIIWLDKRLQQNSEISFANENNLRAGLIFGLFIPLCLVGLVFLYKKSINPKFRFGPFSVCLFTAVLFFTMTLILQGHQRQYLKARIFSDFGLLKKAVQEIDLALKDEPDNPQYLHFKSLLLLGKDDFQDAISAVEYLKTAVAKSPKNARLKFSLSLALERTGKIEEAIEVASQALDIKPNEPALWQHLGNLHLKMERRKTAVEAYKKSLQFSPNDPQVLNNLAYTLLELGEELPTALNLAKESVRLAPGFVYNQDTLAWALYLNGSVAEAFEIIKNVKNGGSVSPEIDFHYAVIANEIGLLAKPREVFDEILSRSETANEPFLKKQILAAIASCTQASNSENASPTAEAISPDTPSAASETSKEGKR